MMLSLDTAYRSFGGEVEASSTPTICRLPDSRRHQLWAIARREVAGTGIGRALVDIVILMHGIWQPLIGPAAAAGVAVRVAIDRCRGNIDLRQGARDAIAAGRAPVPSAGHRRRRAHSHHGECRKQS